MRTNFDLRLEPSVRAPRRARRSLEPLRSGLDERTVGEAMLLLSEVVTNSVRHADLRPGERIDVRVHATSSWIHVDVIDPGRGFGPGHAPNGDGTGGWGLRLLAELAQRWGIEHDGTTRVWFELDAVSDPDAQGMSF